LTCCELLVGSSPTRLTTQSPSRFLALFIKDLKLYYVSNFVGIKPEQKFVSNIDLKPGKYTLGMEFTRTGEREQTDQSRPGRAGRGSRPGRRGGGAGGRALRRLRAGGAQPISRRRLHLRARARPSARRERPPGDEVCCQLGSWRGGIGQGDAKICIEFPRGSNSFLTLSFNSRFPSLGLRPFSFRGLRRSVQ
jgi:hypothetical protein